MSRSCRAKSIRRSLALALFAGATAPFAAGADLSATNEPAWPQFVLRAESVIPLNLPGQRLDASGLLLTRAGALLTVNDRGGAVYQILLRTNPASGELVRLTNCFTEGRFASLAPGPAAQLDGEGLAQDDQGRLYLCEEANRWILRCERASGRLERLPIDWLPVTNYFSADRNASFEGLAVGDGRLYVANERSAPVILAVDLASLQVVDHFVVIPQKASLFGTHYSDLAWWDHRLFVLCRQHQVVLEVEPRTRTVLAEYDYAEAENQLGYGTFGVMGLMEGLAVDRDHFWLVIDNNGLPRQGTRNDTRPVLLKCPRPGADAKPERPPGRQAPVARPRSPSRLAP